MRSLSNRINKLEKIISQMEKDTKFIILFAISSDGEFDEDGYIGIDDKDIEIEPYAVPDDLKKYTDKAKNLKDIKVLGEKYNFEVFLLPTTESIKDIWTDELEIMSNE